MRFRYDHDVDTVFALINDPAVFIERCQAFGETNVTCDATTSGNRTTMKISRTVRRELPGPLAKIAKPENTIRADGDWVDEGKGAAKRGSYTATVDGSPIPITIKATYTLTPSGAGACEYSITFDIKAKHMLLGKIAEKFVRDQTEAAVPDEVEWNRKRLAAG